MAGYVDGFVIALPKKNLKEYRKLAKISGKVWKEYGALDYVECFADDVPKGKWTSFPRSVKLKPNEIVVFSYVTYKSRADRNRIMKKIMHDERMLAMAQTDVFDGKRMIFGGFKPFLEL